MASKKLHASIAAQLVRSAIAHIIEIEMQDHSVSAAMWLNLHDALAMIDEYREGL